MEPLLPAFPGAIGVSHLRVYGSEAPDGLRFSLPLGMSADGSISRG